MSTNISGPPNETFKKIYQVRPNIQTKYGRSPRQSKMFQDNLETFQTIQNVSIHSGKFPENNEIQKFRLIYNISD